MDQKSGPGSEKLEATVSHCFSVVLHLMQHTVCLCVFVISSDSENQCAIVFFCFFRYLISHDTVSKYPTHLAFAFRLSFFLPVKLFIGMR